MAIKGPSISELHRSSSELFIGVIKDFLRSLSLSLLAVTTFDLLQLLGSMPIVRRRYSRSSLVVWGLPWERRVGEKRQKRDEIGSKSSGDSWGANPGLCPPTTTTSHGTQHNGIPALYWYRGRGFLRLCRTNKRDYITHSLTSFVLCVYIFRNRKKKKKNGSSIAFHELSTNKWKEKKNERIGADQTLHRSRRPDWNKVRTECAPGTRLYILNGFYITIKLAYSINYTYRYKYRAYIYLIL